MSDNKESDLFMRRRKIKVFLSQLPRAVLFSPLYPVVLLVYLVKWLLLVTLVAAKRGTICVVAERDDETPFVPATLRALALIKKHDTRRYAVLQKELHYVENLPMISFGSYHRVFRHCAVDFSYLSFDWEKRDTPDYADHYSWYLARYAALFIHEATYGRLARRGFPYTKRTRVRIERICEAEARRFAARLPQTPYNFARDLIPPFDPARWNYLWNTPRLQQAKAEWRRAFPKPEKAATESLTPSAKKPVPNRETAPRLRPLVVIGTTGQSARAKTKKPYSIWPKRTAPANGDEPPNDNVT